jgi:hypothetical protein
MSNELSLFIAPLAIVGTALNHIPEIEGGARRTRDRNHAEMLGIACTKPSIGDGRIASNRIAVCAGLGDDDTCPTRGVAV